MSESFPQVYLVRHGQTAWSVTGQHTGRSDIPLTPAGEENARQVGRRLSRQSFSRVFVSPSQRARHTCELAGFGAVAAIDPDLAEWDYGQFEGLRSDEIHQRNPTWDVFRDGGPGGESVADISARADRVVSRLRAAAAPDDKTLVFSSGHFLRVLSARWLGQEAATGRLLLLGTGSISILSYEHTMRKPVIALWNEQPQAPSTT